MSCIICNKPNKSFSGKKLSSGYLCEECSRWVPSLLLKRNKDLSEFELKHIIQKTQENFDRFSATSSFGTLHIDEIHGLFCIAKDLTENNKPKHDVNIFSIYDLSEVGLTCTSPRASNSSVVVDVELRCRLENPSMIILETVKRSCRCQTKRKNSQYVTWEEPHELEMFKTLFNQMLSGAWEKVNSVLCGKTVYAFELEKARAVFMLPNNYTRDELIDAYNLMKRTYDGRETELALLNRYYYFLQSDFTERRIKTGRQQTAQQKG